MRFHLGLWTLLLSIPLASACVEVDLENEADVKAVLKCQQEIKRESRSFVSTKMKELQACVDAWLEVEILADSELETPEKIDKKAARAAKRCNNAVKQITKAEGKLIDQTVKACEPVEDLLFDEGPGAGDPLGLAAWWGAIEDISEGGLEFDSVEEFASLNCGFHEGLVLLMIGFEAPRALAAALENSEIEEGGDPRCFAAFEDIVVFLDDLEFP